MTDWLVDTLIATSGLMLLVLLVREPVRRQFGAAAAYALWLIPAARIAMPPMTQTVERMVAVAEPGPAAPLALASLAPAASDPSLVEPLVGWPTLLLAIWGAGAILFLAFGLLRYRRQRRAALDGAVQLARLGSIRLVRSEVVRGPIAFGILDRVIAVPHDFEQRFDEAQRRLALDHELSHHRSGDLFVNHLAFVLLGLFWFNPLAWLAHAAFRFDQEAACDARVLDRAGPSDRRAYGHAIAKAASGRTLLFASALDHHHNLHRRLSSMLTNPTPARRMAGKLVIVGALAIALPLTATWATRYVDVAAPTPPVPPTPAVPAIAPLAPLAPMAPAAAAAPIAPLPPLPALPPLPPTPRGKVMIDGRQVDWNALSPAEKARIRASLDEARRGLAATHIDRAAMRAELEEAMAEMKRDHGDMRRDLEAAKRDVDEAMREIDANAASIRRVGQDPEVMKATVRASLAAVRTLDIEAMTKRAMAGVDAALIERSIAAAEAGIARAEAEIDAAERDN
jgi:beta-lactamase regulating signal transducer with metallopeptidase domain